jgi:UDP-N-acetylglucosamine 2-epimerase (non-hydrolysing)
MTLRVLSIFGTRPEAVKMAPILQELGATSGVQSIICVTAQHREMLNQVLQLFEIKPQYDLDLMQPDQSLATLTAAIFSNLDPVLRQTQPDWVLVQGDTTTVMAAATLAFYHHVRVGHVEAGLRTGYKYNPFPEEINRRLTSVVADLHFAPTEWSRENLLREGIPADHVVVTGNPVIDALQSVARMPPDQKVTTLLYRLGLPVAYPEGGTSPAGSEPSRLVLITAHRRENFGEPLENICIAIRRLAEVYVDDVSFVYPVHLNPNVQETVYRLLAGVPNITLLPPLDYLPFVHLLKCAALVLTDSGGLQEEAPAFGVPVLVLRDITERPEGIEAGTVKLVGTGTERIISETQHLLEDPQAYAQMAHAINPYGDGHASPRIVKTLLNFKRDKS